MDASFLCNNGSLTTANKLRDMIKIQSTVLQGGIQVPNLLLSGDIKKSSKMFFSNPTSSPRDNTLCEGFYSKALFATKILLVMNFHSVFNVKLTDRIVADIVQEGTNEMSILLKCFTSPTKCLTSGTIC